MSNASTPISTRVPTTVFGETFAYGPKPDAQPPNDQPVHWAIVAHTERLLIGRGATIMLQTSDMQRANDMTEGTWIAQLTPQGSTRPLMTTQFPWCPCEEARARALEWARSEIGKLMP